MPVMIDGYLIDAALSEAHTYPSSVTSFPVETGANITDHIRDEPIEVEINGIVSDTPIGALALARANETAEAGEELEFLPSDEALARLIRIRDRRPKRTVTIQTSRRVYENMAMTSLDIPVDQTTGKALRFTARFQQIMTVTNLRTTIRTATPAGKAKTKLGSKVGATKTIDQFHRDVGSRALVFTVHAGKKPDFVKTPNVGGALVGEELMLVDDAKDNAYYRANKEGYRADGYVKGGIFYPLKETVTIPTKGQGKLYGVVKDDTTAKVWHKYSFNPGPLNADPQAAQDVSNESDDPEARWVNIFNN